MREIISIHVGQAGVQVSLKIFEFENYRFFSEYLDFNVSRQLYGDTNVKSLRKTDKSNLQGNEFFFITE